MRAYISATLNLDQLAFTQTSSYCSGNISSISGENKRGDILKFGKTEPQRENGINYCCQPFALERDLENRLVSFHGRCYHRTRNIERPSLEKLIAMKNLDAGKPVGCLPALLDPLGSLLEFLTGFLKCAVQFRVSP